MIGTVVVVLAYAPSLLGALPVTALAQNSVYAYRNRGAGDNLRQEGIKNEPRAGSLSLLSFTIGRLSASDPVVMNGQLRVRFFSPIPVSARLTVRELHNLKSYQLDADRAWSAGWDNVFEWPIREVIDPLEIDVADLGVVVTTQPGLSGTVFPALFARRSPGARVASYSVVITSKYTCAPLLATLSRRSTGRTLPVVTQSHPRVAARAPKALDFDVRTLPEGTYTLRISCEREGRGSAGGVDSVQAVFYDFYHPPALPDSAVGDSGAR